MWYEWKRTFAYDSFECFSVFIFPFPEIDCIQRILIGIEKLVDLNLCVYFRLQLHLYHL